MSIDVLCRNFIIIAYFSHSTSLLRAGKLIQRIKILLYECGEPMYADSSTIHFSGTAAIYTKIRFSYCTVHQRMDVIRTVCSFNVEIRFEECKLARLFRLVSAV